MARVKQADKLMGVCYDIRGAALMLAEKLEADGYHVRKLNTGNTYPFGLETAEEIIRDVMRNLSQAQGYIESKGLFAARKAVMQETQRLGIHDVDVDAIYIGNGVSELISMTTQAMLDSGDEVLIPRPDYPLWSAAVRLAGGEPKYYHCDEQADWYPDLGDIEAQVSEKTKALVVINPNNPTGSVYPLPILEGLLDIARRHDLVVLADEIYQKITYDGAYAVPMASLATDVLIISYDGLSKAYRLPGFRVGWMVLSGPWAQERDFIDGLDVLSSMRLCSNVPGQYAIQTALGGRQSLKELILPGGRLHRQRGLAIEKLAQIPGVSCVKPRGALYAFPRLDHRFNVKNDLQFICDLLQEKKILVVQGSGFNMLDSQHFRLTFLPHYDDLEQIFADLSTFLENYRQVEV